VDITSCLFNCQLKAALCEVQSVQKRWSHMPIIYFKRQASGSFDILFRAQRLLVKCYNSFKITQDGHCAYNVTWGAFVQPFLQGKNIIITYSECMFVDLGIQHAMRMCRIVICGLPKSTQDFYTLSHKRHDFWKEKKIWHKISFSLQRLSRTYFLLRTTERGIDVFLTVHHELTIY